MDAALEELGRRRGAVLAFSGEGGIGKTRLLDELAARAEGAGALLLSGRASELERELPFGVWEDALAEHAEFLGVDRLERLVGDQLPELAAVLPAVGRVPAGLQDERYRTHRAVRVLLEALAQIQPLVVVLDDLHWADDASLELVAHLLRRPPRGRVALALAFRPAPIRPLLATALATAERDGAVIEHALGALSFADAETLLGTGIPGPVRGEIYEAGGGNPFFLQQLARQHAAGRAVTAEPAGAGVPQAVARALEQEIAALGEAGRALAQGAAVAGDPVDLDLAAAAADLDEEATLGALDELLAGALLVGTAVPRRYRFRHPLVRNAIYASAADGWRIAAHARVAAALAARGGSIAARAHHLERCARPGDDEALEVLIEAGRHAAARAPATAADRFGAALRLLPETAETMPRRLELLVGLAQALAATGRLEEALGSLDEGLSLVGPGARSRPRAPDRGLRDVREPARPPLRRPRAADRRARRAGRGGLVGGRRPRGRARRRRAVRQRLRERALVGRARAGHRRRARRRAVRGRRGRARLLRRARAGRDRRRAGAARRRRGAAGRARRRRAGGTAGHGLLPGLRRVLLRALRRRDPPLPPRHRGLADQRAGPVRDPDDDRARARVGGPRAIWRRPPTPRMPPSRARACGATARCSASR